MKIYLRSGMGTGQTPLSAFDAALRAAGIANQNLLYLSSVIPPNSVVLDQPYPSDPDAWGHKLFVVCSEARSRQAGTYIGAALGWCQFEDGRGVFVEHHSVGETELAVRSNLETEIKDTLNDLCDGRGVPSDQRKCDSKLAIVRVDGRPASVLVVAVYESEGWQAAG